MPSSSTLCWGHQQQCRILSLLPVGRCLIVQQFVPQTQLNPLQVEEVVFVPFNWYSQSEPLSTFQDTLSSVLVPLVGHEAMPLRLQKLKESSTNVLPSEHRSCNSPKVLNLRLGTTIPLESNVGFLIMDNDEPSGIKISWSSGGSTQAQTTDDAYLGLTESRSEHHLLSTFKTWAGLCLKSLIICVGLSI